MFPQPGQAAQGLMTPSRHAPSRLHESYPAPRSERFDSHSRQSSVQPEPVTDEGNLEDVIRKMREFAMMKSQLADEVRDYLFFLHAYIHLFCSARTV